MYQAYKHRACRCKLSPPVLRTFDSTQPSFTISLLTEMLHPSYSGLGAIYQTKRLYTTAG